MQRVLMSIGALMGGLAVLLGAFGAHALSTRLGERGQSIWALASRYALMHAVALVAVAAASTGSRAMGWAGGLMAVGVSLFSGSLYGLALGGPRWLGPVTPLGGTLLLAGWTVLGVAALLRPR